MDNKKIFLAEYYEIWKEINRDKIPANNIRASALLYYKKLQVEYLKFLKLEIPISLEEIEKYKPVFFNKYAFWEKYKGDCPSAIEHHISNILRKIKTKTSEIKWIISHIEQNQIIDHD